MKIVAAYRIPKPEIDQFLQTTDKVNKENLLENGYVLVIGDKIKGCFILQPVEPEIYWLKQLHIAPEAAGKLPVLLETIVQMTKEKQAEKLYVQSHQPVVDILLDALQFYPQKQGIQQVNKQKNGGKWWAYKVS
ncbi:hypothetical protein P5G51_003235 [Virgibacillus sp. 179-BFC.A HS]|uniref:N-acetyltransferase domain-containing protein n=1 Tax=Tigheibacillus jepli TaxID=3035914 RepID=A0ABU5CDZ4_9BACI|nr:hypothetical protein [Virgibacillus sp. 179-BFC.A HS]MDY0404552.1 hypothetical protein [Virgibacillus sp. 179-BFC.A HS]